MVGSVAIELRPLTAEDAPAHCAGQDELTVRWLAGLHADVETTVRLFERLAENAAAGTGKRGLGIWMSGQLCGYIHYDPDNDDGIEARDVSVAYAVHPWARGHGVAVEAVRMTCEILRDNEIGTRAAIRVEPENTASVRVAEKAGFRYVRDFPSSKHTNVDGRPTTLSLYVLDL
jgi:RimJ/RimL family protein N-acetyltransferase